MALNLFFWEAGVRDGLVAASGLGEEERLPSGTGGCIRRRELDEQASAGSMPEGG
jgi:hypothetical protein